MPQHDLIDDFTRFTKLEVRSQGLDNKVWGKSGIYLHLLFNYPKASMPHFTPDERIQAVILQAQFRDWLSRQVE